MKMLDLFSGLGGASQSFTDWDVVTVDINPEFNPMICKNILDLNPDDFKEHFDLIWASPPCPCFSVAQLYNNWKKRNNIYIPQNKRTIEDIKLVYHTLYLIDGIDCDYWFMENPRGMLRKVIGMPQGTVTYCQYGHYIMKPTDLWGKHPESFVYKKCNYGDDCHDHAPRGFAQGTQHIRDPAKRAKIPEGLSKAVKESIENPIGTKQVVLVP